MTALQAFAADSRGSPGCVGCSVATDLAGTATVHYAEEWRTEDDLRRRLQSDGFMQLMMLIEEAIEVPRVEFALPEGLRGLDFVAEVRRSLA
jgi:quinol monooxygenase YgiN